MHKIGIKAGVIPFAFDSTSSDLRQKEVVQQQEREAIAAATSFGNNFKNFKQWQTVVVLEMTLKEFFQFCSVLPVVI